jgi:hypothetical protein
MVQTLPAAERKARVERFLEGVEMTSQKDKYPEFGEKQNDYRIECRIGYYF